VLAWLAVAATLLSGDGANAVPAPALGPEPPPVTAPLPTPAPPPAPAPSATPAPPLVPVPPPVPAPHPAPVVQPLLPGDDWPSDLEDRPAVSHPILYTTLETALVLAGGTIWYLRHGTDGRWSRALEWQSWQRKFLAEDVTFDGDRFNTNAIGHPIGGASYYQIARSNGIGPGGSFLTSVLASTFWEYFIELPEHPSLNDMIMTPVAGAIIGETTYRLGRYLARSGTSGPRCAGAFLFAPLAALNDLPICRSPVGLVPWAKLGFVSGFGRTIFNGGEVKEQVALAVASEIVTQRAYERPGRGAVVVGPGQWTALYLDTRWGDTRLAGLWFHGEAMWGGRYDRHYRAPVDDTDVPVNGTRPRGWGTMIGLGSVFDYRLRDLPTMHDRVSTLGLGGPMFELSARGSVHVRLSLSAQYAFAIVGSMAYRTDSTSVVGQTIKTSLRSSGYYYAHGLTSAARLIVDLGPVGFCGDVRGGWYWSIDSGDPAQSALDRAVLLRDTRLYLTGAMWTRPFTAVRFGLTIEHVRRSSHMLDSAVIGTEDNILATAAFGF
jgi:hypothetical protein